MDRCKIQDKIAGCRLCSFIDKPPCIHRIYERFLPSKVRVLVVSESPPPGRKPDYLYNLGHSDRLRSVLAIVFQVEQSQVVNELVNKGIFWTTAVKCRPPSKRCIEEMRRNCTWILEEEIRELRPVKIVALGKTAWESLAEIKVEKAVIEKDYHPLYIARFKRERLGNLREKLLSILQ